MPSTKNIPIYQALLEKKYLKKSDIAMYPELQRIAIQINTTNPRQVLYHAINQLINVPTCQCGNELEWHTDQLRYRIYCSKKCTSIYSQEKRKQSTIKKYGTDHFSKTKEYRQKSLATSIKKYGVSFYSQTIECKQSVRDNNIKRFGTKTPFENAEVREAAKIKWINSMGVDNPGKCQRVKEKIKNTNISRRGHRSVLSSPDIKSKIKDTMLSRYGVDNPAKNKEIAAKRGESRKTNYYDPDVLDKLNNPEWLKNENKLGKSVGQIALDLGISSSNLCKYYAKYNIEIMHHYSSSHEQVLCDYLDEIKIPYLKKDRKTIYPYELDILIPNFNLAIEINGGYWHHEGQGKDQKYHLNKTKMCSEHGIELWHFFDWEIEEKLSIIKSKLSHKLKLGKTVFARKLSIKEINNKDKSKFMKQNHIQGDCASSVNLALVDSSDEILCMVTFGKSRFNKSFDWELLRACSQIGISVVGGVSRLLNSFIQKIPKHSKIISYCNLRFSTGNLYEKIGFTQLHQSSPNFFYVTKNGNYAGSRNQWQKHMLHSKLPMFDPTMSESDNMRNNGYNKIWDCGNLVYQFNT